MGRITLLWLATRLRWSWRLSAGAALGVMAGFTFGLLKPRVKE